MKKILGLLVATAILVSACSTGQVSTQNSPRPLISKEGTLSCLRGMRTGNVVTIMLEGQGQDDEVRLVDYRDDLLALCQGDVPTLKIQVNGEITSRFLFWGGNLSVKTFKVLQPDEVVSKNN